jgi:ferritin
MNDTKLISDSLREALLNQITHENLNSAHYLYIAGDMFNRGFEKTGEMFKSQYSEEEKHKLMIFDLLKDLNVPISIGEVSTGDFPINSPIDIANKFLEREIITTESLTAIRDLAMDDVGCCASIVEGKMREMIMIQLSEMSESTTFMDQVELSGNNWFNLYLILEK